MELEWVRVRELFFDHFLAKKAKALRLKEESPLDYMPFIVEEFYRATSIPGIHWVDQEGELFPWAVGPPRPSQRVTLPDWGTATQVSSTKAQQVLPGLLYSS